MKKLLITVMTLSCFVFSSYGQDKQDDLKKQIVGKWYNPYTYEATGEFKGFEFKEGGECSAINIPSLDLKTWKIDKDGYLIIEGFSRDENGEVGEHRTRERIDYLTPDSLELVTQEEDPHLSFIYLKMKSIKK